MIKLIKNLLVDIGLIKSDALEMLERFYTQNIERVIAFYGYWWWAYP